MRRTSGKRKREIGNRENENSEIGRIENREIEKIDPIENRIKGIWSGLNIGKSYPHETQPI